MSVPQNPEADAKVADAVAKLKTIQNMFGATPTHDVPFCVLVSHVAEYQHDIFRLRRYGSQVIGNRSMQFAMLTAIKSYWNIQTYLDGVDSGNPLALPAAARAQIELFAVAWHVFDTIVTNGGFEKPDLVRRMLAVDEALIMATHGTRSEQLNDCYRNTELSKLRQTNSRDIEVFKAKNILTRIQKAGSGSEYTTCCEDYDRLSEMLHPNSPQNLLFTVRSPKGDGWFRLGLHDPQHIRRAQYQSAEAMLNASAELLRLVSDTPDPFALLQ